VTEVRVGLGYTAALLDDGACGVAYTFRSEAGASCCAVREAGTLAGVPQLKQRINFFEGAETCYGRSDKKSVFCFQR